MTYTPPAGAMPCVWRLPLRRTSREAMEEPSFSMYLTKCDKNALKEGGVAYQSLPAGARKREERKNDSGRRVAVLLMT